MPGVRMLNMRAELGCFEETEHSAVSGQRLRETGTVGRLVSLVHWSKMLSGSLPSVVVHIVFLPCFPLVGLSFK